MKHTLAPPASIFLSAVAFCATLALSPAAMSASPVIKVDGSSTVYPITELAAQGFRTAKLHEVPVEVGVSGTSAGFTKFCAGDHRRL
jgi:phosphate transport system substrate-binding protein